MVICLIGDLGSGKTLFTKAFAKANGITDDCDELFKTEVAIIASNEEVEKYTQCSTIFKAEIQQLDDLYNRHIDSRAPPILS